MITKFKSIKNFAVFQNFNWDTHLRDKGNNICSFKQINILYGRNYSGKTTLSRVIRGLETGKISERYDSPEFTVLLSDATEINHGNLNTCTKKIRVFNEDFIRDNLKFINLPDENIEPFAILGGNTQIEDEIKTLKDALGNNEDKKETGLYLELVTAVEKLKDTDKNYQSAFKKLDNQLTEKATDRKIGIKYKPERFGDVNYTKPKLEAEILSVLSSKFGPVSTIRQSELERLLIETPNAPIPLGTTFDSKFQELVRKSKELITREIGASDKIDELVKDAILNRWVKEGRLLHKEKRSDCAFCGNLIDEARWEKLDKHFDEESKALEDSIDLLIVEIVSERKIAEDCGKYDKGLFYSKFQHRVSRISVLAIGRAKQYINELNSLEQQLRKRKDNLINSAIFSPGIDYSDHLQRASKMYEAARQLSNKYTASLTTEQTEARKLLRLKEVHDFTSVIRYSETSKSLKELEKKLTDAKKSRDDIKTDISKKEREIEAKKRLLNDEEKGAIQVNKYLNDFFGHDFLSLQAISGEDQLDANKKARFEIFRGTKKAHHLSEGECSLIAFCYFMAKLDDIQTKNTKPIIWIDDPISSLDSNHIFFVYSLINVEIVAKEMYEQLFVSTHNLDFLKYLKRLPHALNKNYSEYFIITRDGLSSKIKLMPQYLKNYVTEFNYLFHQIYKCSVADDDNEEDHHLYYNFANNTRKFLEAFLFYKYPNAIEKDDKLRRFFGEKNPGAALTDRVNNEYSHLEALFERSMRPIDVPEMKKVACFVLSKIAEKDNDQYQSLLKSVGIEINSVAVVD
jgi:wobble nucleotide-excising tRNase